MWSLNLGFQIYLCTNFHKDQEGDRFFSATVCDDEIFASCHCDKCELVKVLAILLLLIFDYQLVLPFDFLTFNKIFVVDYATSNMIVEQYVCCWLRDNAIECWLSTNLLSPIQQHCQTFNIECPTINQLTYSVL